MVLDAAMDPGLVVSGRGIGSAGSEWYYNTMRKKLVDLLSSLLCLTVYIDRVRFGAPDRTPRDPA